MLHGKLLASRPTHHRFRHFDALLIRSATRLSLLPVPELDLLSDQPAEVRGRVIGLDREYLAIGRDL
jgi:hypothetical protein